MKRNRKFLLALAGLCLAAAPALGQVTETAPIRIKAPKARIAHFEGYVLSSTRISLTVRDKDNANLVRTFSMSQRLRPHWERQFDSTPYQYGDHVKINYLVGSDTAVKIKGRASPPVVGAGTPTP